MRRIAVLVALVLAFAAGWLGRGCAAGDEMASAPPPTVPAAPTATRSADATPAPVRRERAAEPESRTKETPRREAAKGADAPKPSPDGAAEAAKAAPRADGARAFDEVTGVVVDNRTGEAVDGVRLHLCYSSDGQSWGWFGDTSHDGGKFKFDLRSVTFDETERFELRGGRDGYRVARAPVTTGSVRLEIEKLDRAQRPGRIVGTARTDDGKPLAGRLMVSLHDELDLHSCGVWTVADANGRFALDGIAAGNWRVALSESGAEVAVNVAEDGETPVELVAKFDDPPTGAFAAGTLDAATYERVKSVLDAAVSSALAAAHAQGVPESQAFNNEAVSAALWQGQQFEYQWLRHAPGRYVVVSGLPSGDGAFVRLEHRQGAGCEWRTPVKDGQARFASVPYGRWRAVLVRPGAADASADVEVAAGDGAMSVTLAPAK
jgi:hypothetical protein